MFRSLRPYPSTTFKQLGQYHGAGNLTGFGLRLWHLAQRKRLPFTAVFGRAFFPLLRIFRAIRISTRILSDCALLADGPGHDAIN
jgi:hypothetical protein